MWRKSGIQLVKGIGKVDDWKKGESTETGLHCFSGEECKKGCGGLRTGIGVRRSAEKEWERKQLRCPGQSGMGHNPLERGDRVKAGGGKDTFLNQSHRMRPSRGMGSPSPWLDDITPWKITSFLGSPKGELPAHPAKFCCFLPAFRAKGLALKPWVPSIFKASSKVVTVGGKGPTA